MTKIRIAVVSAGGIGGTHLKAYYALADRCEIAAIADVQRSAAEERTQEFGGAAFADYVEMLDQIQPDAISICTPPHLHLAVARAAAQRQIAALCEKPPARTLAETEALVEAMAQSGAPLQFAFCHRFHEPVVQAQELIASGRLGRVVQVYNRFGFRFARAGSSWFTEREVAGGGILIDTLVHSVDIFRTLAGEVTAVAASISTTLTGLDVEDSASVLVTSQEGVIGALTCSWVTPVSEAEIRIYSTEGEAIIDCAQPGGLRYRLAGEDGWTQRPFDGPDRFYQQAQHFLESVATGKEPAISGRDGIAVMRVIDAAYRSAHQRGETEQA